MAGTVIITEITYTSVKKITFDWKSDASGNADATTTNYYDGEIIALITKPAETISGTTGEVSGEAPSNNYDIELLDNEYFDVLMGKGLNRSNISGEYVDNYNLGAVTASKLTLQITNAGDKKSGKIGVWIR